MFSTPEKSVTELSRSNYLRLGRLANALPRPKVSLRTRRFRSLMTYQPLKGA
jgi:hypothetical protein